MAKLQNLKRSLRSCSSKLNTSVTFFMLEKTQPKQTNFEPIRVRLLVVKQKKYAEIARMCVISFLHFHPNAEVLIHADENTILPLQNWIKKSKFFKSIKIVLLNDSKKSTWQEMKLSLIFQLSGTSDIFIDADMKWNGPLENSFAVNKQVFFFVEEYKLLDNAVFKKMLEHSDFSDYRQASMWNTSFVSLSGLVLNSSQQSEICLLQQRLINYFENAPLDGIAIESMIRISEQLAISLAAQKWDRQLAAVKQSDGYKDGTFLESSYFGATGTHF